MGHITTIVLAQDLTPHRELGDEPEALEVVKWNINDIDQLILRDDFSEGRSVAALLLMQNFLKQDE
jgi:ADP-ribose diphosphatase